MKEHPDNERKTVMQKLKFELSISFFGPGADGYANSLVMRIEQYFADVNLVLLLDSEN